MTRHNWIVFESASPFPHETCRDAHTKRAGEVDGPHYRAGARWYTPGFGRDAERNRAHVALMVETWRERGYDVRMYEELR